MKNIDKNNPIKLPIIKVNIVPKLFDFELSILSIKFFKWRKQFNNIIILNIKKKYGIDKYNQLKCPLDDNLRIKIIKKIKTDK